MTSESDPATQPDVEAVAEPAVESATEVGAPSFGPPAPKRQHQKLRAGQVIAIVLVSLITAAGIAGPIWLYTHPQQVIDQIRVLRYTPTAEIADYARASTMTDEATFLFYASRPTVESEDRFDKACSTAGELTGVVGCYLLDPKTIYLFDVTDRRLDGLEDVIASHEMLHAVWDRMGKDEQAKLGKLLEAEAAKLSGDTRFTDRMDAYAKAEPGARLDELHSIIGTEIADIGTELETHYARYFAHRTVLTDLSEKTNAVFDELDKQAKALVDQIDALVTAINSEYDSYNAGYDQLNSDVDSFNYRADNGQFYSESQFNTERNALIQRQTDLDAMYTDVDAKVTQYDDLVEQLDSLQVDADTLYASINIDPPRRPGH